MTRIVLITALNLALPFLLWAAKVYFTAWMHRRYLRKNPDIIDVTPSERPIVPYVKLFFFGLFLLGITLAFLRISGFEQDTTWTTGNQARSEIMK